MVWSVFFLALLTYCTGIDGQSTWTQPPSSSVSPGGTVTLSCLTTHSSYNIGWYQQKAGEGPHFVHCDGCSSRGEGIPNRFTATRSGNTGSLAITNAEAGDEAVYYCGNWNSAVTELHGETVKGTDEKLEKEEIIFSCLVLKKEKDKWNGRRTQHGKVVPGTGGTVTLSCTTTQSTKSISWFQQKPGEVPRYVHCSGCSDRGEGIPDRFTATTSGTTGSLAITNVQAEDEADYYCGSWNSADTMLHGVEFL
ncbi:uncharacterized protein LOC116516754 [Thamnophis elegans]|uniref:uncharacterized protein LOC116516754 n=1 Tax=Thamnophis elegans TaxID=35005 RepID=UPI001378352B|nr:uncharacterized protein LOC116516754 [Thamnophis elegans]